MMMEHGTLRNFEQIQEHDAQPRTPRGVTVAFVALGGACIVFAAIVLTGRKSVPQTQKVDPLGALVAERAKAAAAGPSAKATDLSANDVTFPGILSDDHSPTTALAAVRNAPPPASLTKLVPPPPTDRLPVVPLPGTQLPAQNVLEASPIVTHPRDSLTQAASDSAQIANAATPTAAAGHDGGYQLQVSSFRTQAEANQFSDQLRARGHKAYVLEANVPGRGNWYRVRIGPFASQHAAAAYRSSFEQREHVVPFIVPPSSK